MAYDPLAGTTHRLVTYWLPWNANNFDYSHELQHGVIHDGVFLRGGLHWLLPDRLERVGLPLGDVGYPRWSPDGRYIAARGRIAAPEARASATDSPSTLFLIAADGMELRALVEGVREAAGVPAWSPDGRWLAARLTMEDGRDGIWLIEVATGTLHPVLLGEDVGSANWSPDGRSLVVAVGTYSGDKNKPVNSRLGLYFIDLPDLGRLATATSE